MWYEYAVSEIFTIHPMSWSIYEKDWPRHMGEYRR